MILDTLIDASAIGLVILVCLILAGVGVYKYLSKQLDNIIDDGSDFDQAYSDYLKEQTKNQ